MAREAEQQEADRYQFAAVGLALEKVAQEEKEMRDYMYSELKSSWEQSSIEKKARDAIKDPQFNRDTAGKAAVQKFEGEDDSRGDRIRQQQQQLARWTKEQLDEKALIREDIRKSDKNYDDMLMDIDRMRGEAHEEEKALRKSMILHQNKLNAEYAKLNDERKAAEQAQSFKDDELAVLPIVNEQKENALSNSGNVGAGLRANFKGYTRGQVRMILKDNDELMAHKRADAEADTRTERIWRLQQDVAQKEMEQAFMQEQLMRAEADTARLEYIKQQMVDEEARRKFSEKDRFGSAGHVFFNRFGSSCR